MRGTVDRYERKYCTKYYKAKGYLMKAMKTMHTATFLQCLKLTFVLLSATACTADRRLASYCSQR
jgi:hypothetical protein